MTAIRRATAITAAMLWLQRAMHYSPNAGAEWVMPIVATVLLFVIALVPDEDKKHP